MPIKGILIILLSAAVFGVAYSREIYTAFTHFMKNNKNEKEDKENKE